MTLAELTPQPTSVQSLYGSYAENKIFVNRRYQRKLVWTLEEKQRLIESIIKRYPIPAILVAEKEGDQGSYEIIDGLQRLQAIMSFIEGAFPGLDGKLFNLEHFPTAKIRSDSGVFAQIAGYQFISQKDVSTVLDYSLSLSVMRGATDAEIDDVFDRINTYGHRLSDQERRQAGVQNDFSEVVRKLASNIRGDQSPNILPLANMPSISVNLPTTKHGYAVEADQVFWVDQGVLRATELRDSMDEQCVAEIVASIVLDEMVDRSKDYLDSVYERGSANCERVLSALEIYGAERVSDEIKFCIDQISLVCVTEPASKLRSIIFTKKNTNSFPSVFTVTLMAFHNLFVKQGMRISNYDGVKEALTNVDKRINASRGATTPVERQKNVDTIRVIIEKCFLHHGNANDIYENHSSSDIDVAIRRSEVELNNYELKQGIVRLANPRTIDDEAMAKILATITAIANNGKDRAGKIILGVTDKSADVARVRSLDNIEPRKVSKRFVVGINREARALNKTVEQYYGIVRDRIKNSAISEPLKSGVLSSIDYNSFFSLGVIVLTVPPQKSLSFYGDDVYWREGDTTMKAENAKSIADLAQRF